VLPGGSHAWLAGNPGPAPSPLTIVLIPVAFVLVLAVVVIVAQPRRRREEPLRQELGARPAVTSRPRSAS